VPASEFDSPTLSRPRPSPHQSTRKGLSTGRAVLDVFLTTRTHPSIRSPKNVKGGNLGQPPSGGPLQATRQAAGAATKPSLKARAYVLHRGVPGTPLCRQRSHRLRGPPRTMALPGNPRGRTIRCTSSGYEGGRRRAISVVAVLSICLRATMLIRDAGPPKADQKTGAHGLPKIKANPANSREYTDPVAPLPSHLPRSRQQLTGVH
jgi:hypothetical protein